MTPKRVTSRTAEEADKEKSSFPTPSIVISATNQFRPPEVDDKERAVHVIRLSALQHNFQYVESAAARQRCGVIAVIKADGYGHGAHATALHLADCCGTEAFAVATLEEAVSLRKAFEQNPPGRWSKQLTKSFHTQVSQIDGTATVSTLDEDNFAKTTSSGLAFHQHVAAARCRRPAHIRILVLGPPVGFPRCFNDYYHYGIEVMVSGPEVAQALMTWVANEKERKSIQVERAAREAKERALLPIKSPLFDGSRNAVTPGSGKDEESESLNDLFGTVKLSAPQNEPATKRKVLPHPSSTLSNVSGKDLAREVRAMLLTQKAATEAAEEQEQELLASTPALSTMTSANASRANSSDNSISSCSEENNNPSGARDGKVSSRLSNSSPLPQATKTAFCGIEAAAKLSRSREMATNRSNPLHDPEIPTPMSTIKELHVALQHPLVASPRKCLRWHGLVDTGMGRLGFKTELADKTSWERDAVEIIRELVNAEIHSNAPIEFYGMCTHMADANSPNSTYTQSQMDNFVSLLDRMREVGITIPTVSSDNSAALLSTSLTHFDPDRILSQPNVDTRGFVRTGGAIFGQRPAFKDLQAVSTLIASVRHVNVIKEGQSVGYDRAFVAPYDVRIATLTVGFADGLPRDLGNGKGKVAINGAVFPIVGKVCMDMIMVGLNRVDDTDGPGASVVVGDTAVLWGPFEDDQGDGLVRLQDVASTLGTTQSALTCGLSIRVSRRYV
jgi:alanine racemase